MTNHTTLEASIIMGKIPKKDWVAWGDKTEKLNENNTLQIGNQVRDMAGYRGIVVKIVPYEDEPDNGTIYVWQLERTEYGIDNCEHYHINNWKRILRIE